MSVWVVNTSPLVFLGTLGVLLLAKQHGEIVSLRLEIERLMNLGFVLIHGLSPLCCKVRENNEHAW